VKTGIGFSSSNSFCPNLIKLEEDGNSKIFARLALVIRAR
jgi:hypothetical protein